MKYGSASARLVGAVMVRGRRGRAARHGRRYPALPPFVVYALAVVVLVGGVVGGRYAFLRWVCPPPPPCCTTVRGLIGSEKLGVFADEHVVAAFRRRGLQVEVTAVGSHRMAAAAKDASNSGTPYDFVFPGGEATLSEVDGLTARVPVATSPLAVASSEAIAEALHKADPGLVVKDGPGRYRLVMQRYLDVVAAGTRWDAIPGSPLKARTSVLVRTTDPRDTNSASLFAALAATVAKGGTIGKKDMQAVHARVAPIFLYQGALDSRTEKTFNDYLDLGRSHQPPLVLVYEAQFLGSDRAGPVQPVLLYPSPTILSRHTLGVLSKLGEEVGRALTDDSELRKHTRKHGFRSLDGRGAGVPGLPVPASPGSPSTVPVPELPDAETAPDNEVLVSLAAAVTSPEPPPP